MKAKWVREIEASQDGHAPRVKGTALLVRSGSIRLAGAALLVAIACFACSPTTSPDSAIASADVEVIATPGHAGGVSRAAFFPGGERLITTGWNGELRVWDTSDGSLIGLYRGHDHRVSAIAVSPSGTQFVTGDTAGNLMLWSFGDLNPRKLWTHTHSVRNVAFTGENEVLSLSYDRVLNGYSRAMTTISLPSLVSHDLLRGESHTAAVPSDGPRPELMTFVGSRYLLLAHHEGHDRYGDWRGSVLDIQTLDPIAELHEISSYGSTSPYKRVLDSVEQGNEPFTWGPSGILIDAAFAGRSDLLGVDFRSGDVLWAIFCTANYCARQTLDILAVDDVSRRIAYVTDSGNVLEHVYGDTLTQTRYEEYADTLLVASIAPLRQLMDDPSVGRRDVGDQGTVVRMWPEPGTRPAFLSDIGGIPDVRRELPYARSLDDFVHFRPPRDRAAQSSGVPIELPEDLTEGTNPGELTSSPHPFTLEHTYQLGGLNVKEGESTVQGMGAANVFDVCSGTAQPCSVGATGFGAMSSNARWVAGSTDNEFFATSLWLYHDVTSVEAAQSALRELGYLADDVRGIDVEADYHVVVDMEEPFPKGSIALDGWLIDGEWIETGWRRLELPYDIGGYHGWRLDRDEDGQWRLFAEEEERPVSVRKTRLGRTVEALLRFQGDRRLATTGVLDERTRDALGVSHTTAAPRQGGGRWLWYQLPPQLRSWHFHQGIAFAPDDSRIAIPGGTSVYMLDVRSGEFAELASDVGYVVAVEFASNDELLVVHPFGVVVIDVATGGTQVSPIGELGSIEDIRAYDGGNAIRLEGRGLVVLARRSERGQSFEETARVRWNSDTDWVAVTPAGFYAASEQSSRQAYLRVGARVLPLDQFYDSLHRPDLVRESLAGDPTGRYRNAASRMIAQLLGNAAVNQIPRD